MVNPYLPILMVKLLIVNYLYTSKLLKTNKIHIGHSYYRICSIEVKNNYKPIHEEILKTSTFRSSIPAAFDPVK